MTQESLSAKLLAMALFKLGGSLSFTQELLDSLPNYNIVWDTSEPNVVTLKLQSAEILLGKVKDDVVEVDLG